MTRTDFSARTLSEWVRDARERAFELVADLTDEQLSGGRARRFGNAPVGAKAAIPLGR